MVAYRLPVAERAVSQSELSAAMDVMNIKVTITTKKTLWNRALFASGPQERLVKISVLHNDKKYKCIWIAASRSANRCKCVDRK